PVQMSPEQAGQYHSKAHIAARHYQTASDHADFRRSKLVDASASNGVPLKTGRASDGCGFEIVHSADDGLPLFLDLLQIFRGKSRSNRQLPRESISIAVARSDLARTAS